MKKKKYIAPEITNLAVKIGLADDCVPGSGPASGECAIGSGPPSGCFPGPAFEGPT